MAKDCFTCSREPQEGAPSVDVAGSGTTGTCAAQGTGGVPSCDSELVAIKARDAAEHAGSSQAHQDRRALLRVVDELTRTLTAERKLYADTLPAKLLDKMKVNVAKLKRGERLPDGER